MHETKQLIFRYKLFATNMQLMPQLAQDEEQIKMLKELERSVLEIVSEKEFLEIQEQIKERVASKKKYNERMKEEKQEAEKAWEQYYKNWCALTEEEINENIKNGLLPDTIKNLGTHGYQYTEKDLKKLKALESIHCRIKSFYITNHFLIKHDYSCGHSQGITITPLKYVKYCRLAFGRNSNGRIEGSTWKVKKDPGKGALIGGLLGGATGAIIGLARNLGTETKSTAPSSYNDAHYNLEIKINDYEYTMEDVCTIDLTKKYHEIEKKEIEHKNDVIRNIIAQAK